MESDSSIKVILESLGALNGYGKADLSERFIAVMSNTIPGRGNSQYAVFECLRKNGVVGESVWPSNENMTQDEFFLSIPQEIKDKAKKFLQYFTFEYEDVGESNTELKEALKRSPLCVVIGGVTIGAEPIYRPVTIPVNYNHQVENYNQENNVSRFSETIPVLHDILDSYDPFRKKFVGSYPFKFVKTIFIKPKYMQELYKKNGEPAIYALDKEKKMLVPFLDGIVSGGSFFKTIYGVDDYRLLPRQNVDVLPYPIADYGLSTVKFNKADFE